MQTVPDAILYDLDVGFQDCCVYNVMKVPVVVGNCLHLYIQMRTKAFQIMHSLHNTQMSFDFEPLKIRPLKKVVDKGHKEATDRGAASYFVIPI